MAISHDTFRHVLAQWASGVTVVTSQGANAPEGLTVSSFSSVSLDPPLVLVCVHHGSDTLAAIEHSRAFAVNVLAADQGETGKRFAGLLPDVTDRFEGVATTHAVTGSPVLVEALAMLDCRVWHAADAGDHRIIVGEVVAASSRTGQPLVYHARRWRALAGDVVPEAAADARAYEPAVSAVGVRSILRMCAALSPGSSRT